MFFIHICFSTSSLTLPWTITRLLHPFYTFSPAHCRVIRNTFIFNFSVIFLPRALRFWVAMFYPQAFFTLCSFTHILICIYQGFPGSRQFFLEVCRASYWSSKHRAGPSVCLIYSNPQSKIYNSATYYHELLVVESLGYMVLTHFELFFASSRSYVKTIKKHFEQDLYCFKLFRWTSKYFEKAAKRYIK